jgi:hypothetical protein
VGERATVRDREQVREGLAACKRATQRMWCLPVPQIERLLATADHHEDVKRAAGLVAECLVSHNEATFTDVCDLCHAMWPADDAAAAVHSSDCPLGRLIALLQTT